MAKGIIVEYIEDKGYGFIRSSNHKEDIFFHISNISNSKKISIGQNVNFDINEGDKGLNAVNIIAGKMQKSPYKIYGFLSIILTLIITLLLLNKNINLIISYLGAINIVTFLIYGYDKYISTKNSNMLRVPERVLLLLGLAGGSISALLAQNIFRHKTQKKSFQTYFWLVTTLQIIVIVTIYYQNHH